MGVFKSYAKYYDLLYKDKNYDVECDFIEESFSRFSRVKVKNILELGCGTGGHALHLAKRNYQMTGIDVSEVMLKSAREKTVRSGLNIDLHHSDIRDFNFDKNFDSIICMFAVLNYLTYNEDFERVLRNVRNHLIANGLFIIDIWNGLAVLRILPSVRAKIVEDKKIKVIRIVEPELDALHHLCRNHYKLIILEDNKVVEEIEETHVIRYLFPQEIKHYLEKAGFEVLKICPFPEIDGNVDENIWNISVIAKVL